MASKTKATPQKEEAPEKETSDSPDSPLLDLSDAAVRKMIKLAKKRGWVTHDQINAVLPSEEVSSDQIEDIFAMLNEMGINVVESEETEQEEAEEPRAEEPEEEEPDSETLFSRSSSSRSSGGGG
ncbi:MAG: RNA polymerase sigma factor region1.1 domain-containing protein, partial [Xanthobacteraceae bacterium]